MLSGGLLSTYFWLLLYSEGMFLRVRFFAQKFLTDRTLHFWVTTCQGIVPCGNRYTKVSKGIQGDSLFDSFPQNHYMQETIQQFHTTDHGSIPPVRNFDFKVMVA